MQPAVATEDEFGLNLPSLNRFNLELVQANRITRGAFLAVPLSLAQSGGFTSQVQNAADISARTTELSLETDVFTRPDVSYSFTLTGDHTKQKIDHLGRAPFRVPGLGQGQDMFYYKQGEPLGIMYGTQWVRTFASAEGESGERSRGGIRLFSQSARVSDQDVDPWGSLSRLWTPTGRTSTSSAT